MSENNAPLRATILEQVKADPKGARELFPAILEDIFNKDPNNAEVERIYLDAIFDIYPEHRKPIVSYFVNAAAKARYDRFIFQGGDYANTMLKADAMLKHFAARSPETLEELLKVCGPSEEEGFAGYSQINKTVPLLQALPHKIDENTIDAFAKYAMRFSGSPDFCIPFAERGLSDLLATKPSMRAVLLEIAQRRVNDPNLASSIEALDLIGLAIKQSTDDAEVDEAYAFLGDLTQRSPRLRFSALRVMEEGLATHPKKARAVFEIARGEVANPANIREKRLFYKAALHAMAKSILENDRCSGEELDPSCIKDTFRIVAANLLNFPPDVACVALEESGAVFSAHANLLEYDFMDKILDVYGDPRTTNAMRGHTLNLIAASIEQRGDLYALENPAGAALHLKLSSTRFPIILRKDPKAASGIIKKGL